MLRVENIEVCNSHRKKVNSIQFLVFIREELGIFLPIACYNYIEYSLCAYPTVWHNNNLNRNM